MYLNVIRGILYLVASCISKILYLRNNVLIIRMYFVTAEPVSLTQDPGYELEFDTGLT